MLVRFAAAEGTLKKGKWARNKKYIPETGFRKDEVAVMTVDVFLTDGTTRSFPLVPKFVFEVLAELLSRGDQLDSGGCFRETSAIPARNAFFNENIPLITACGRQNPEVLKGLSAIALGDLLKTFLREGDGHLHSLPPSAKDVISEGATQDRVTIDHLKYPGAGTAVFVAVCLKKLVHLKLPTMTEDNLSILFAPILYQDKTNLMEFLLSIDVYVQSVRGFIHNAEKFHVKRERRSVSTPPAMSPKVSESTKPKRKEKAAIQRKATLRFVRPTDPDAQESAHADNGLPAKKALKQPDAKPDGEISTKEKDLSRKKQKDDGSPSQVTGSSDKVVDQALTSTDIQPKKGSKKIIEGDVAGSSAATKRMAKNDREVCDHKSKAPKAGTKTNESNGNCSDTSEGNVQKEAESPGEKAVDSSGGKRPENTAKAGKQTRQKTRADTVESVLRDDINEELRLPPVPGCVEGSRLVDKPSAATEKAGQPVEQNRTGRTKNSEMKKAPVMVHSKAEDDESINYNAKVRAWKPDRSALQSDSTPSLENEVAPPGEKSDPLRECSSVLQNIDIGKGYAKSAVPTMEQRSHEHHGVEGGNGNLKSYMAKLTDESRIQRAEKGMTGSRPAVNSTMEDGTQKKVFPTKPFSNGSRPAWEVAYPSFDFVSKIGAVNTVLQKMGERSGRPAPTPVPEEDMDETADDEDGLSEDSKNV